MSTPVYASFNAGELSPKLDARSDLEKYSQGARRLENFIILPQGGLQRRSGFKYVGKTKDNTSKARLISFNFSSSSAVVIECGYKYMRFYADGEPIMDGNVPLEIATPWTDDQLEDLKYKQSADVIFFAHPEVFPHKLSRYSNTDWVLEEIDFQYQAFKDENVDDDNVLHLSYVSGSNDQQVNMTFDKETLKSGMETAYWLIRHPRSDNEINISFDENNLPKYSGSMRVKGDWTFTTHGNWSGEVVIERSFDGGTTWHNYRNYSADGDRNIDASGTEELDGVLYRVGRLHAGGDSGTVKLYLNVQDYFVDGIVRITSVTDAFHAVADVIVPLGSTNDTGVWAEGAWCPYSGFPSCLAFFEERLAWASTRLQPQTIWMSKSGDYQNLTTGGLDDDALIYTISSGEIDDIRWMVPQNVLLIGTIGNEWKLGGTKVNEALTPTNVSCKLQSNYGSANIDPVLVGNAVLYTQEHAKIVREMSYDYNQDKFVSVDLTLMSDHIAGQNGFKEWAYQKTPFSILWMAREDGTLVGMTYNRKQGITAWHRHITDGKVLSIATINGDGEDELWLLVEREIEGVPYQYIERMGKFEFNDVKECRFLDSYLDTELNLANEERIGGLSHLQGKTVSVFCDGAYEGDYIVSDLGTIEYPHDPNSNIAVGLPYTSLIETMRLEGQIADGGSQPREKRIDEVTLRFLDTVGGKVVTPRKTVNLIPFRDTTDPMDTALPLYFGDKKVKFGGGYNKATTVTVLQDIPLPMTILMISPRIGVYG